MMITIATDRTPRQPAVDMDLLILAEEMMITIATAQLRNPVVVMAPTMTTTMAQPRSPAAAMVPLATMMTIMDRGPRHLAVVTDLRPPVVETMMTTAMAPPKSLVADMAVETTAMTAMAPPRSLAADMAVEPMTMTTTALETNQAVAAMVPKTLVPRNTRQVKHLAATIGMTRAVCRRN